jgi:plasmid stabilization system protein ParE
MTVRFRIDAQAELEAAIEYYETRSKGLGEQYSKEIIRLTQLLLEFLEIGEPVTVSVRLMKLSRFPFSLIYAVDHEVITILAVAHQHRRPGYWKNRV